MASGSDEQRFTDQVEVEQLIKAPSVTAAKDLFLQVGRHLPLLCIRLRLRAVTVTAFREPEITCSFASAPSSFFLLSFLFF